MKKYWNFVVRMLIKEIERFPRNRRSILNSLVRILQPIQFFKEITLVKKLLQDEGNDLFEIPRKIGFSEFTFNEGFGDRLADFAVRKRQEHLDTNVDKTNSKDYLRQIWDLSKVRGDSLYILQWALDKRVLRPISRYMDGRLPRLHEISIFYSPESNHEYGSDWKGSQLLHMDGGGTQCVKIWLLCQDVLTENGPTVVIPADQSALIAKEIGYKPGTKISQEIESKQFSDAQKIELVGKKGTWFATDTDRSFHYGSRTTSSSSRLVAMFHYIDSESSYCLPLLSKHYTRQFRPLPEEVKTYISKDPIRRFSLSHRFK